MTTIDTLRKALEALEALEHAEKDAADFQRINTDQTGAAITALRAELARLEGVEPVAWLYTLEYGSATADTKVSLHQLRYPFGVYGADYLRCNDDGTSYVRETPLYTANKAPAIPALTREEFEDQVPATLYSVDERGAFATGARWAYALAAERAGVRIKEEGDIHE